MILTKEKRKILSGIAGDIGQVFFASVLVEPIMNGKVSFSILISGFVMAALTWYFSIFIIKESL